MIPCLFKSTTGVPCPGCGFQRAVAALLSGDLAGSLILYSPLFLILLTKGFLILHLLKPFTGSDKILYTLVWSSFLAILINYFIKLYLL